MAKTGQTRKTKQPLKIDRLPTVVIDSILYLRNERGKPWLEIEAQSAEPFNKAWRLKGGGFVDWDALDPDARRLFPKRRLPHSNLQRWWDLRVAQVSSNVERMAAQAREIAQVFAKAATTTDEGAMLNATRDILLGILAEDGSPDTRASVARGLLALASVMQQGAANKIRERSVAIGERKLKALEAREALARRKMEAEAERLTKKATKGQVKPEDVERLYERVFGPRPKAAA